MTEQTGRSRARKRRGLTLAAALTLALALTAVLGTGPVGAAGDDPLAPIDAQNWVDQEDLTWDAYAPVPDERPEFYDGSADGSQNQYQTAVILLEFTDQPFLITQPPETHPFGNPQPGWTPVPQSDVSQWMHDYYAVPNEYNGFRTLSGYWMEDSHGKIGIDVEVFGPYKLPGKLHEYGMPDGGFNQPIAEFCPQGDTCGKSIRTDGGALWRADIGCASGLCGFDNGFYVTAGHDESSTWQEFGEMLWMAPEEIPDEFGPPRNPDGSPPLNQNGEVMENWSATRYVDWTSWAAAANHWPNASGGTSTQAESSGQSVFAHEFSHLRGLPDNYNNPFADNIRNFTGYFEMMSRGTFNGPGGTHNRWQIPNAGGSALGPHHMLHFKNQLGVLEADDQVTVTRDELVAGGVAVASVQARSSVPEDGEVAGFTVEFGEDVALNDACEATGIDPFYCPPSNNWDHYRMEVVDRVGNDSFAPGHGVLLAHSRTSGTPRVWTVDANPEDIGMIDFFRPDGTPAPVVRGDPRQLNDATFHAGTNSGSDYEYVDETARLHFYVLDTYRDEDGVLSYDLGVRHLDGAGPFERGVEMANARKRGTNNPLLANCEFPLRNSGEAGEGILDSDIYRLSASSSSDDWEVTLPNALAYAKAGERVKVSVLALRDPQGDASTTVTLTATSESDPSKSATRTCKL
ncbi:MAG: immune inhibitor A domain-containing protein [Gaiellaceae bacterium]